MEQGEGAKLFNAVAWAALPEHAMVARLANMKLRQNKPFGPEEAKILVRSLYPEHGNLQRLANLIYEEYQRQRPLHKSRIARKLAEQQRNRPIHERLGSEAAHIHYAQRVFGDYVRNAFSDDVLALLELLKHEHRVYEVKWLAGGPRPVASALVEVVVLGEKNTRRRRFLLYKLPTSGKILAATTSQDVSTIRDAWAYQVPEKAMELAAQGYQATTDFERQALVLTGNGEEIVLPWRGATNELEDMEG